jgi:hypothetical protein
MSAQPVAVATWHSAGVLAAAYLSRPDALRRHAVLVRNGRAIHVACDKVKLENLASDYDTRPVDCMRCLRVTRKTTVIK